MNLIAYISSKIVVDAEASEAGVQIGFPTVASYVLWLLPLVQIMPFNMRL